MQAPIRSADDPAALVEAVAILAQGGLVAVPTETVYGLAADATSGAAVARIYEAKGRPAFNPLIAHVDGVSMASRYGGFDKNALELAEAFWPGPLTVVIPIREPLASAVHAGLDTVALRHAPGTMSDLAKRLGRPIAAPSANMSGRLSPTTAQHVVASVGDRIDLILDGGPCAAGLESTIVAVDRMRILRPGVVTDDELRTVVGKAPSAEVGAGIEAPGMLASHYAPSARLRLEALAPQDGELLLGFGEMDCDVNLSRRGDLGEAARQLYASLAAMDARTDRIAVAPIPNEGIGLAINDRLRRAAT